MDRLERALSGLSSQGELTNCLVQVLAHASKRGRVAYYEVERMIKDDTEDVLLLGREL